MANEPKKKTPSSNAASTTQPHPFDVTTIEHLINLMAQHDLSEIALQEGEQRIRLRKGALQPTVVSAPAAAVYSAPQAGPAEVGTAAAQVAQAGQAAAAGKKLLEIKSEMVGAFYSKPKPDAPEFVKVGQAIKPGTTVCLIEAMKIFNEIKAEVSGTIVEVCVNNGDAVDFGTVLFRVDPA